MKRIVNTDKAPAPIGPYSQAVQSGNTLFISGQIALDPSTGELRTETIESETTQVMDNIQAILAAAGMGFKEVVKTSIFITDMHLFSKINEVYGRYIDPASPPARETVEVANLPKFVRVEISMIAVKS